ncbi:MAG TPA: bifunctional 4-hydroxy-2-oxoglutarate aldolase/2-dehydro-3-deoxy-phosphogluconate aldolase [Verrucomicrobiae bacterium]|nr:bifunctional 4-hydroxy-2-oxoglutarate aldolase/2-dehydro-3-deoxy-phosphogluconate aldolase [Verrucomicrobiae bacterium]
MLDARLRQLFPDRLAAVIRWSDAAQAEAAGRAVVAAGFRSVEVTMSTPDAAGVIARLRQPGCSVGAGTVVTAELAEEALRAGAEYLVTPYLVPEVARVANAAQVACVIGAQTATEVRQALDMGADMVKIFPASPIGGPGFIQALRGPLPECALWVSGGVELDEIAPYLAAGTDVVGLTTSLLDPAMVRDRDAEGLATLARRALAEAGARTPAAV